MSETAAKLEEGKCFITCIPCGGIHACVQTSEQNHLTFCTKAYSLVHGPEEEACA